MMMLKMMVQPLVGRTASAVTQHQSLTVLRPHMGRRLQSTTVPTTNGSSSSSGASTTTTTTTSPSSVPIVASLVSALFGVAIVSGGAAMVEYTTADSCLPYSPLGQRFDQSTFAGRFSRMFLACDPRLLLYTQAQVQEAQAFLRNHQEQPPQKSSSSSSLDRELWEARRIVDAALHPDTGEFIPLPFRMSGYVPFNGPICVAMVASTTTPSLLFWSWVNQSQNALVNYYNRNASSPMSNETLALSYSAAVGSALMVAFGLATFIQKKFSPQKAQQLMKFVAFPSAVVASSLNCYIVRSPEIDSGIPLLDEHFNPIMVLEETTTSTSTTMVPAISHVAARQGVYSTTLSRAFLQAPVYFLPPLLMSLGPLHKWLKVPTNARHKIPLTTALVLVSFGIGLPASTAMVPQMASIPATDVEPAFQRLINPHHSRPENSPTSSSSRPPLPQPYTVFFYNKGL